MTVHPMTVHPVAVHPALRTEQDRRHTAVLGHQLATAGAAVAELSLRHELATAELESIIVRRDDAASSEIRQLADQREHRALQHCAVGMIQRRYRLSRARRSMKQAEEAWLFRAAEAVQSAEATLSERHRQEVAQVRHFSLAAALPAPVHPVQFTQ
jgi:hypothetical protein